jgi:hypothetical protein
MEVSLDNASGPKELAASWQLWTYDQPPTCPIELGVGTLDSSSGSVHTIII